MADGRYVGASHQVIDYLKSLDQRISKIEEQMGYSVASEPISETEPAPIPINDEMPDSFEFNLGEFWFAYIGIFVLMVGCLLLMSHPVSTVHPVIPTITGFLVAVGMYYFGHVWRESYKFIALHLWGAAYILLFFATFRLFQSVGMSTATIPWFQDSALLLIGILTWMNSIRHKSAYLNVVSLTLVAFAALVINQPVITLTLNLAVAALFVFTYQRSGRLSVFIYGSLLVYLVHLHWALGNPLLGEKIALVSQYNLNLMFLLLYTIIFSSALFWFKPEPAENETEADREITLYANALANGLVGAIIYSVFLVLHKLPSIIPAEFTLFAVYFTLAVALWRKIQINIYTITFTLIAFGALSIGVIGATQPPDLYIYLIWQSLLVLATAIWFRSKFIVAANFFIFLLVFARYSAVAGFDGIISISFGIVALISARLLNWQKNRLTIQTELMRNAYLFVAFISIPFTLWKSLPGHFVGLAWLALTVLYYGMGLLLKNGKYRWMAHFTLFATILYILIYATTGFEPTYRILTFVLLGLVLIGLSILFSHFHSKLDSEKQNLSTG
ncbi:MAG: hypothetical protein K9M19_04335 [Candidatus Marinimicrobia bacterium]|nr:hypothetical protein [Candidatus Neomarinimicrobiota bacterium]